MKSNVDRFEITDKNILPALLRRQADADRVSYEESIKNSSVTVSPLRVQFETVFLNGILLNQECKRKKLIIHCRGNGEFFQDAVDEYVQDAQSLDCMVAAFNYPGVCSDKKIALSTQVLIDSIVTVVNFFEKKYHLKSDDIILKGHSLGGALAILAAKQLHDQGQPIYVFASRTFANLSDVLKQQTGWLANTKSQLPKEWEMNVFDAYSKIPNRYKQFVNAVKDRVITLPVSLYQALINEALSGRREAMADKRSELALSLLDNQFAAFLSHQCPLDMLANGKGQDGHSIFVDYFNRSLGEPAPKVAPSKSS